MAENETYSPDDVLAGALHRDTVRALADAEWFRRSGVYVLVDGQFGSTGKGLAAALCAVYSLAYGSEVTWVSTNAGPNSGHTAVVPLPDGGRRTWINKQLPIFTSVCDYFETSVRTYLNGGAVIAPGVLMAEYGALRQASRDLVSVHPHAAVVREQDVARNAALVRRIASTGQGTAPAAAARILREGQVYSDLLEEMPLVVESRLLPEARMEDPCWRDHPAPVGFIETSQGYSLGINSGFYPKCTHRECTVAQALADARVSPARLRGVFMVVRSYPIRVGDTEGSSGGHYSDQREMSWEEIGVEPELTTVTRRVRRVFSWSWLQYREALAINTPSVVLLNFANYLAPPQRQAWIERATIEARDVLRRLGLPAPTMLVGYGPSTSDVLPADV
jgi:adenylosuccinate synthase